VVAAALLIALTASSLQRSFPILIEAGGLVGTLVSVIFLFAIAMINLVVLVGVFRVFQRVKRREDYAEEELNVLLARRGLLSRLFRTLFRLISRSWHMYPLGFLFALGFDTATEIGLLGISAAEASNGLSIWSILVFPALFTAGMSLVDTSDGVLMVGAYGWAFMNPLRKLYYNLTITAISVVVAFAVGAIEALGLVAEKFGLTGGIWSSIDFVAGNFTALGYLVVGIFVASWLASLGIYRAMGYHKIAPPDRWPPAGTAGGKIPRTLTTARIASPIPCSQRTERVSAAIVGDGCGARRRRGRRRKRLKSAMVTIARNNRIFKPSNRP
jgi:nickel/cobalt transporter (NiCoT) family protein